MIVFSWIARDVVEEFHDSENGLVEYGIFLEFYFLCFYFGWSCFSVFSWVDHHYILPS